MREVRTKHRRIYEDFAKELDMIKDARIKKGIDTSMNKLSDPRVTRALLKSPNWGFVREDVINMPRDKDVDTLFKRGKIRSKKGAVTDLFLWIIVGFITLIFFGIWIYANNLLTDVVTSLPNMGSVNVSLAGEQTFGAVNNALPWLHTISFLIFFGLGFSIVLANLFVRSNPYLFIIYVLFLIGTIIMSVYISNEYESILANPTFGATFQEFTATNFFVAYLPIFVTVLGFFGAITLFINIQRVSDIGVAL